MTPGQVGSHRDDLGESPVWDDVLGALFWVDIRAPALRRCDWTTGGIESRPMPSMPGSIALARPGRLLVALADGMRLYDWRAGTFEPVCDATDGPDGMRFNDGRCDRQGRFWVGTMHNTTRAPLGGLYRLDGHGLTLVRNHVNIPNSLSWSPDGRAMYFADSPSHDIEVYEFDTGAGTVGQPRRFAAIAPPGFADGSTVDAEGCLWNAEFNMGRVVRYAPDGRIDRVVEVPMRRPTSCGFGGPGLDRLFVTSTSQFMTDDEKAAEPMEGALLMLDVGVRGLPEPRWAGDAA